MSNYLKIVPLGFIVLCMFACKKNKQITEQEEEITSPTNGSRHQFTLDSILLYARQMYLWNDVLPTYADFNPREKYGQTSFPLATYEKELFDICQYKTNPKTGHPYELSPTPGRPKYSFLQLGRTNVGAMSADLPRARSIADLIQIQTITTTNKSIGYISLKTFPELVSIKKALDDAFAEFALKQPSSLIVDLRSNPGGYVETAEYVANLIAPTTLNDKVMYKEVFNAKMQNGQASILKYQPFLNSNGAPITYNGRNATLADVDYTEKTNTYHFSKVGKLESIKHVYFIVSSKTASASELLISSLKPYVEVTLVGERTYGKPVGFFGINIDQYSLYLSSFLIKNSQDWAEYFDGMSPDINVIAPANPVIGSLEEPCLKAAISDINGKKVAAVKIDMQKVSTTKIEIPKSPPPYYEVSSGMVETRLKLKH